MWLRQFQPTRLEAKRKHQLVRQLVVVVVVVPVYKRMTVIAFSGHCEHKA